MPFHEQAPMLSAVVLEGSHHQEHVYSYFEKMCTRQCRKVTWDMIDTLFLMTVAVEPTFVAFR